MNSRLATKRFSSESTKVITKGALREIDFSTFDVMPGWEPREGCTYTVTRAISARINQNYDGWPSEELKKSYRTFLGKPVFVNHINDDPRKARGVVVASRYVEADDDKYIEVIQEVDAKKFPKLAHELATGGLDGVSMGCEAGITKCSYCGNQATDMLNMCAHVIRNKGQVLGRVNPDGSREDVLVYEECRDIKFFELSYVFDPADETAVISNVITANNKKMSFGETSLPPQVDTLRDEDEDIEGYFIEPPEQFKEPDLDLDYPQTTNQGVAPMPTKNINSRSRRRRKANGGLGYDPHQMAITLNGESVYEFSEDPLFEPDEIPWVLEAFEYYDRGYAGSPVRFEDFLEGGHMPQAKKTRRTVSRRSRDTSPRNRRRASGAPWDEGDEPQFQETPSGELILQHGDYEATVFEDGEWTVMHQNRPVAEGHAGDQDDAIGSVEQWFKSSRRRNQSRRSRNMGPRARRNRFAEDRSRNDQGEQEDAFISQTPPEEPVETGDGASDAPNNSKSDRVKTDPNRSTHTNLESRRRARSLGRRRRADQSDDFNLDSRADIARDVEDEEVLVSETGPATNPKDATRRKRASGWSTHNNPTKEEWKDVGVKGNPTRAESFGDGLAGVVEDEDGTIYWSDESGQSGKANSWEEGKSKVSRRTSRRRKVAENFEVGDKVQWVMPDGSVEPGVGEITDVGSEGGHEFYELQWDTGEMDEGTSHNLKHYEGSRKRSRRTAGSWSTEGMGQGGFLGDIQIFESPNGFGSVAYDEELGGYGVAIGGPGDSDIADPIDELYADFPTEEEARAYVEKHLGGGKTSRRRSSRRRTAGSWEHADGESYLDMGNGFTAVVTENGIDGPTWAILQGSPPDDIWGGEIVDEGVSETFDDAIMDVNSRASKFARKSSRRGSRRRVADDKLDLAAPDGRINVEAPTSGTTDEEAQASQYDKSDYGHNAGDDIADPDLTTDQNWAPGEGKKSSSFNKRASQIEAMRLAEAMVEAGLETHDDRWKLAETYTKLPAPIVRDRIALLSRVASVSTTRRSANVQRPLRSARRSPGLGQQPILEKSSSRVDDYTFFL